MTGKVVLGHDGSDGARAALAEAARLAAALDAEVVLVFGYAANPMGGETQDQEREMQRLGKEATDEAVRLLEARGVSSSVELVHERPDAAILAAADASDAAYIVVGATGVGPIRGAILGSVAYKLVHRSLRPIVIVPAARPD